MRPSETATGQAWLQNFAEPDVPSATVLLDSLRFVTLSAFRNDLSARLNELAETGQLATPAVVLQERGLQDFDVEEQHRARPVAYDDFHPGEDVSATPGSEGFIGAILRDLPGIRRPRNDAPWIAPQAEIEDLRARHCRSIVIVTDNVGSGDQLLKFAAAIARNRTIRSWRSFGWLQINAVVYAGSPTGLARLRGDKLFSGVWTVAAGPTLYTAPWRSEIRDAIVALCRTECRIHPRWALGYRDSASLLVTERGASNNLPAVLWQTAKGWEPLFPERTVPASFARDVGEYHSAEPLPQLARRVGHLRIGRNERLPNLRATSRLLLSVLLLLDERRRDAPSLAATLAIDVHQVEALLECLMTLDLVDEAGAITPSGRQEIAANKHGLRRTTAGLAGSEEPYYPHTLR